MTVEELSKKLDGVKTGEDWNTWTKLVKESGIVLDNSNFELKRKAIIVLENYRRSICPQEYKDNPHIHYEVAKKKK